MIFQINQSFCRKGAMKLFSGMKGIWKNLVKDVWKSLEISIKITNIAYKKMNFQIHNSTAEFLIFQIENKEEGIEVLYQDETLWLT